MGPQGYCRRSMRCDRLVYISGSRVSPAPQSRAFRLLELYLCMVDTTCQVHTHTALQKGTCHITHLGFVPDRIDDAAEGSTHSSLHGIISKAGLQLSFST